SSSNLAADHGVTLLLGNGDRTFQPAREVASGVNASAIVAADFNNDGNLDFVVTNDSTTGSVVLERGDGKGNFTNVAGTFNVGVNPVSIAAGDFNRDGFLDVVTVSGSVGSAINGQTISVLLNNNGTGFTTAQSTLLANRSPLGRVTVANVHRDALPAPVGTTKPIPVSNVTANGSTIVITSPGHGLTTGNTITLTGVTGTTNANGTWTVTVIDPDTFSLNGPTFNGAYTGGGQWSLGTSALVNVY